MSGLTPFLFRGYLLHRMRGHWIEMALFSAVAAVLWWGIRVACGLFLAILGVLLMGYVVTH